MESGGEEISGRRRRKSVNLKRLGVKWKKREEEEEEEERKAWGEEEEKEEQEGITDSAGISSLLSSFYPGTKLLFRRRLFEFGKPAE